MDCGGGYVKVFPANVDQKNLNGKSQYYIMFGEQDANISGDFENPSTSQNPQSKTAEVVVVKYLTKGFQYC